MKHNVYCKRYPEPVSLVNSYEALTYEQRSIEGRILSVPVYCVVDGSHLKGLHGIDFSLENLIASGSDLHECRLSLAQFTALSSLPVTNMSVFNSHSDSNNNYHGNEN